MSDLRKKIGDEISRVGAQDRPYGLCYSAVEPPHLPQGPLAPDEISFIAVEDGHKMVACTTDRAWEGENEPTDRINSVSLDTYERRLRQQLGRCARLRDQQCWV